MNVLLTTEKVCTDSYIKTVVFDLQIFTCEESYYKVDLRRKTFFLC